MNDVLYREAVLEKYRGDIFRKERIDEVVGVMLEGTQAPCPVRHIFYPGMYIRELTIPKGALAIGYTHKTWHFNVLLKGSVRVVRNDEYVDLVAPMQFYSPPGRNVGYVLEEMVWLNIYPTEERDVETLEAMYLEPSHAMISKRSRIQVYLPDPDYEQMCKDLGNTPEIVREQSERTEDLIPWPDGEYKVKIGKSYIEGKGLLATANIEEGEFICPARIGSCRTPAGQYTNHSGNPNAMAVIVGKSIYWIALRDIQGCLGGLDGEEITVDYRQVHAIITRLLK